MTTAAALRNKELGFIHSAAKALGMDDDTRRDLMERLTGKRSAADLDWRGRKVVIEHLKAAGGKAPAKTRPTIAADKAPLVRKIRALLINHPAGRKPDSYADGISKQMFGVDNYTWCSLDQLHKIAQALAVDARRRG